MCHRSLGSLRGELAKKFDDPCHRKYVVIFIKALINKIVNLMFWPFD